MTSSKHANASKNGLLCPKCGCRDLRAYYTRSKQDHILRRRICRNCGHSVITRERIGN